MRPVSMDIETYGILEGVGQTCFHPVKSEVIDGWKRGTQVVSVAFSLWRGDKPEVWYYDYTDVRHRRKVWEWFRLIGENDELYMIGHNVLFDLIYLRANDIRVRELTEFVNGGPPFRLDDTMMVNFLDFEERPEKGLKALSELYGLHSYRGEEVTGVKGNAKGPLDEKLIHYNCMDAVNTLLLEKGLWEGIKAKMPGSCKMTELCSLHRSQLLWTGLEMQEAGVSMNVPLLEEKHKEYTKERNEIELLVKDQYGLVMRGKGSKGSRQEFMDACVQEFDLLGDERVVLTDVHRDVSTAKANVQLFLIDGDQEGEKYPGVVLMDRHLGVRYKIDSYTNPLLHKPGKGIVEGGKAYPHWHLIPSPYGKVGTAKGTIQGRITATKPGFQTFPKCIKECMNSRFPGGRLVVYDYSQIELRMAAMYSGDSVMVEEYMLGLDRHRQAGMILIESMRISPSDEEFKGVWRQVGKRANFLTLYQGGAETLVNSVYADAAEVHDIGRLRLLREVFQFPQAKSFLDKFDEKYCEFRKWQRTLMKEAELTGRLELKTGWSRSFPGGRSVRRLFSNEICNMKVQCSAAQLVQYATFTCLCWLKRHNFKTRIAGQTYDSVMFDCPPHESVTVEVEMRKILTDPRNLAIFRLLKQVPLEVSCEVTSNNGTSGHEGATTP